MITGADVVAYRTQHGLSRRALASACGLTEGKIWRIETKNKMSEVERAAVLRVISPPLTDDPTTPSATSPESMPRDEIQRDAESSLDFPEPLRVAARRYARYVSNSEVQTFKRCRRKWWLGWYRGLRPRIESSVGVRAIGDRLHRALCAHYSPDGPLDLLAALEGLIIVDRTSMISSGADGETRQRFEDEANLERIILEGYLQWTAETGVDAGLHVVAPETYVEATLPELGDDVAIIGKIDVRVRREIDDARLFIDHKSVGDLRRPTLTLHLDEQMLHYHLLESLQLDDDQVRTVGALYNMLRRVRRTARATPPFYGRVEVQHNKHELASFRRRLVGTISDMRDVETRLRDGSDHLSVAYPRPTQDCTWDCPFFSVCGMFDDGSRTEDMLTNHFDVGDPLSYYRDQIGKVR